MKIEWNCGRVAWEELQIRKKSPLEATAKAAKAAALSKLQKKVYMVWPETA